MAFDMTRLTPGPCLDLPKEIVRMDGGASLPRPFKASFRRGTKGRGEGKGG